MKMKLPNSMVRIAIGGAMLASLALMAGSASAQVDAKKVYTAKCASCHGADGTANTPAGKVLKTKDFHDPDVQKASDADLNTAIAKGKNKMKGFEKELKDDEIKALVTYVRELGKK
jgi:cytochrome c6